MVQQPDRWADEVRRILDACERGDWRAVAERAHPDFEAEFDSDLMPGGSSFRGAEGVERFFASLAQAQMDLEVDVESIVERGDEVLVVSKTSARDAGGFGFAARSAAIWTFQDDRLRRIAGFLDAREGEREFEARAPSG